MTAKVITHTASRIPATIISGFLGSGKTTLLNRILQADTNLRVAVLVNDFGSINIDSQLIKSNDSKVMSLANGCVCCMVSNDLIGQLDEMLAQDNPPEYFLIEASGVSDPGRIARILNYRMFRDRIRIDAIINVLDAGQFESTPEEFRDLAQWQLKQADIVLINKVDQCSEEQLKALKNKWLSADKRMLETRFAQVPLGLILGVEVHQEKSCCSGHDCSESGHDHSSLGHDDAPNHGDLFESVAWQSEEPIKLEPLKAFIKELPVEIYRAKGIFQSHERPGIPTLMQMVGSRVDWSEPQLDLANKLSTLIMIGRRGAVDFAAIKRELDKRLL